MVCGKQYDRTHANVIYTWQVIKLTFDAIIAAINYLFDFICALYDALNNDND